MKGYWVTWEKYWRAPLKSPRACNSLPFSNNSTPRETLCEIKALASLSERVTGSYSSPNAGKGIKRKLERGIEKRNKRLFESWVLKSLVLFWWQEIWILMVLGFRKGRWEMGGAATATALHAPTILLTSDILLSTSLSNITFILKLNPIKFYLFRFGLDFFLIVMYI